MAQSLLAHLYSHIRGSQEDVATLSLQYIISQSDELRNTFNRLIGNKLHVNLDDVVKYSCQATGENQERPDISGKDSVGRELVLCEAKFYAGLTENQPLAYLDRLREGEGKGLVFICPEARITNLWVKVTSLCREPEPQIVDETCVIVDGITMAIITWDEILRELERTAVASAPEMLSDLNQLDGYCKEMDMEAFIPFTSEELGAITARKQKRYSQVIVKTMELIHADKEKYTTKATRTSYNGGFEYKMKVNQLNINLAYDETMWSNTNSKETPFWLAVKNQENIQDEHIFSVLDRIPENDVQQGWAITYIALEPLTNATLDEVAEDLKEQIYSYLEMLR